MNSPGAQLDVHNKQSTGELTGFDALPILITGKQNIETQEQYIAYIGQRIFLLLSGEENKIHASDLQKLAMFGQDNQILPINLYCTHGNQKLIEILNYILHTLLEENVSVKQGMMQQDRNHLRTSHGEKIVDLFLFKDQRLLDDDCPFKQDINISFDK